MGILRRVQQKMGIFCRVKKWDVVGITGDVVGFIKKWFFFVGITISWHFKIASFFFRPLEDDPTKAWGLWLAAGGETPHMGFINGFIQIYTDLYGFIWIYRCFSRKYGHGLIASHIWTSVVFQASAFSTPNVISRECPRVLDSTRTVIWLQTICPALDGEVIHCQILKTDWYHW